MRLPERIRREDALRYLGGDGSPPDARMTALLDRAEAELLQTAKPKYLYKIIGLPCEELTRGRDIRAHLGGCGRAALIAATLGAETDRLIRVTQVTDMPRAVVLDSLASVLIEQVCEAVDGLLAALLPGAYFTFRFSPGYGDYPLDMQRTFLRLLDAPRKIGLSATDSLLLTPSKSITAVAGISDAPVERGRRGCAVCNLRETCLYRRKGSHCGS